MTTIQPPAGYSQRSLVDKLGIKAGQRLALINAPADYSALLGPLPPGVRQEPALTTGLDFVHFFTTSRAELMAAFPALKAAIVTNGLIWISWPKKAAKVATDLDENIVREIGLAIGLVDVKVAAIDQVWSGLKFVYRKADRESTAVK
jgi:hypothetical protein